MHVLLLLNILLIFSVFFPVTTSGQSLIRNQTRTDEFIVEPATLICAGFEWMIYGDENRNAHVQVSYRILGDEKWSDAHPLLRIGGEKVYGHDQRWVYTVPDMFAGSIFNLEPGQQYECRFKLEDPDGIIGENEKQVVVRTKTVPEPYKYGQVYHVYPPGYEGNRESPSFTGLNEAYYGGGNLGDWWLVPEPRVNPGDVILVHAGIYKGDRLDYVDPLALNFHGAYVLTQKGTADRPITVRAAGDGEVIFDGDGAYRLFDVMAADYHYFEGLTVRNTDIAFYAGLKRVMGSSGLSVVNCKLEDVGIGVMTHSADSKDFYIADNVFTGRHDPDTLVGWYGLEHPSPLTSYYAVKVYGQGHVICHNRISFFHDGVCVDTHGLPEGPEKKCVSIDIYGNDIFNMSDDFIESDGSVHNVRVFDNRGFNAYHAGLSAQPVFGGPVYFIRNILYHVPSISLKFMIRPAGLFVYNNTICAETSINGFSNGHFRNNLFMGPDDSRPAFSGATLTLYSTLDHNGFRGKKGNRSGYRFRMPENASMNHVDESELTTIEARDLKDFSSQTGHELSGVELDYDIFINVKKPDPQKRGHVYSMDGYDFALKEGSRAVDAGIHLPNITDDFMGKAPDLGAVESGKTAFQYGPRERNQ
ncbi:MAG: hypothetical protein KFF73_01540 [Cyclobacteriaceae bacterium]|nr:hypothetical protein [Cyclobacteriaceae bacterium]